ncbi:WD40-repeat-containing domain protein [Cristinia sonorae]|uniref:WD40-repeat-containing domain protein n=1 Tax=Cristinia sonorae TaxID=1940300 RepID=A0A8K0UNV0_9AGAR|nr:WD40-repeat-containing domain protein [Cristinia sonorae]
MEDTSPSGISEKGEPLLSQAVITKEDEPSPAAPRARAAPPHANASMPDVPNHGYPVMPMMYPAYLPRGPPGTIPAVPARALHPSLTATYLHQWNPWQFNLLPDPNPPRTPPPEPKNIAHIPSGSYANPLNIKPARAPQPPMNSLQSPVAAASASAKKPVVVGSNWPYNTRSHSRAAAAGTNGAVKSQPAKAPSNDSDSPAAPSIPVTSETPTAGPSKQHSPAAHTQTGSSPEQIRTEPSPTEDKPTPIPADPPSSSTTDKVAAGKTIPPPLRVSLSGVTSYHPAVPSAPAGGSTSLPTPAAQPSVKSSTPVSVSPSTLTPLQTPTSATTSHPLPPKPPAFTGTAAGSYSPRRGVKRMVSPTAATSPEQKHKTGFVWATGDPIFGVKLKSDGDAGIRNITFNSDGTQFAVVCYDKSVRIWNRRTRQEIAKLGHTMQVIDVVWMEHDSGVITLGDNGLLSAWTRNAQNKWQWGKLVDLMANRTVRESPSCFALSRDRLAVAVPSEGVKVWIFMKGSWIPQRSIGRQKVTTIRFVDDGEALVGATEDGTLWHCEVPNGTLKAVKIYSKSLIASLDTDARGSLGLTALADGRCELVNIRLDANKGSVEQTFSVKDAVKDAELADSFAHDFGASFVSNGQNIIFGSVRGCVMVWDCGSGDVVYGLCHTEDEPIHTVSSFNGTPNLAGLILTGSRTGQLTWFTPPPTDAGPPSRKRSKT